MDTKDPSVSLLFEKAGEVHEEKEEGGEEKETKDGKEEEGKEKKGNETYGWMNWRKMMVMNRIKSRERRRSYSRRSINIKLEIIKK